MNQPTIFLVNGYGDQLLSLPAVRGILRVFGGAQLILGEGMREFFYRDLPIQAPVRAFWRDPETFAFDVERLLEAAAPSSLFINLSTWSTPSVTALARRLGATRIVACDERADEVVPGDPSQHIVDRLFGIARWFSPDLQVEDFVAPPVFSAVAEAAARQKIRAILQPGERILFVHPETLRSKMWTPEGFSFVLDRFLEAEPTYRVFHTGLEPYPLDLPRHACRVIWVDAHLELAMAMLRHADLFIGVDSCFLHAADLFRLPGVALFGPTSAHEWGFRFAPETLTFSAVGRLTSLDREAVAAGLLQLAARTRTALPRWQRQPGCDGGSPSEVG